ncbi:MAG: hypothetical protein BM565_13835 [Gammaproteobacteria bacterium MedPE]|nr:MAG: hypothetical protein BM565_13835 [Gammaproteobacteria bacterium MedPE]
MPNPDPTKIMTFEEPQLLGQWLENNHANKTELWVKIYKKYTGLPSVTWDDVVVESLCWGWIDGIKKSVDDQAYLQRITPRTSKSNWSKKNRKHVEELIHLGRMQASGLLHVTAAKADGRWENAYAVSEMTVPEDFIAALADMPIAKTFYDTLNKSDRCTIAHGLTSAKKADTRARRFTKYIKMLELNEKPR